MTLFWLTFRIAEVDVANRSSDARRKALYDALGAISTGWWPESTSFLLFETDRSIAQVAATCKAEIATAHDLVLVREIDTKSARVIGKVEHMDALKSFMPYVSKV